MVELDDRLLRDLARLRERSGPPAGAEQRVRAALDAAIDSDGGGGGCDGGGGDGGGGLGGAGLGGGGKLALAGKLIAATAAVTAVGLVLVNLSTTPERPTGTAATPEVSATTAGPLHTAPRPAPGPEPPIVVEAAPRPAKPQKRPSEPKEDLLAAEVTLLEQARATDDLEARLELLEQHRNRFEHGVLGAERESLWITTLCELGRLDAARRAAEQFLLAHPRSPLRLRMRGACPELDILAD